MTLTRADMAAYIKEQRNCTKKDADSSALYAVEWLLNSVASGKRVELRGFGSFFTVEVPSHESNLPGVGIVPARLTVRFKPADALKRLCGRMTE